MRLEFRPAQGGEDAVTFTAHLLSAFERYARRSGRR